MDDKLKYNIEETNTFEGCISWVKGHMSTGPKGEEYFKEWCELDEKDALIEVHHGYGSFIRNTLELWEEGPAVKWFNSHGIYHPDDMSSIIFTSLHRKQNGKEMLVDTQIKYYIDFWEKNNPKVNEGKYK